MKETSRLQQFNKKSNHQYPTEPMNNLYHYNSNQPNNLESQTSKKRIQMAVEQESEITNGLEQTGRKKFRKIKVKVVAHIDKDGS